MSSRETAELLTELEAVVRDLAPEKRLELIEHLTRVGDGPETGTLDHIDPAERLCQARNAYLQRHDFKPGQLVTWKPGLRNRRLPEYRQPAIVHDVFQDAVVLNQEPPDSPYFLERLDLVLGLIDGEGDLVFFHFDSRRFEPTNPPG